ncbi:hypothetical protein BDP27DRAFT_1425322 [Rhodocollybia butyracea]|uniref:Uncharacterized protein n=1 Tax=Rhodocollybia butyracea TaxID=206335 RepID=A0A9P5PN34_9AGAR|nr:hypothetical protein BDP27DRAFT_1425322 [Rhodocollybia butyracea]
MEMLPRCPSVKYLELEGWEDARRQQESVHYTSHNITSLAIGAGCPISFLEMVFLSCDLPSLNVIVLDSSESGSDNWGTETLISFISRSSCMITTFTLRGISLSDLDLIAALRVMPSLLYLEFEDHNWNYAETQRAYSPITSKLISSLILRKSTSISLVPKLHTLHLVSWLDIGTFDDSAFVRMVESRWFKPGSDRSAAMLRMGKGCIRSVVLKFGWREVDADAYNRLQTFDKEGLRVVVAAMD